MDYKKISAELYDKLRYDFIKQVEASGKEDTRAYYDGKGLVTIGAGFNLHERFVLRSFLINSMGVDDAKVDTYLNALSPILNSHKLNKKATAAELASMQNALDQSWANLTKNPNAQFVVSEKNGVSKEGMIKKTFDDLATAFEGELEKYLSKPEYQISGLSDPDHSYERIALLSFAYNQDPGETELLGNGLLSAIRDGDRFKAWYEIRYRSNGGGDKNGVSKRRYMESTLFGLFDSENSVSDTEAANVVDHFLEPDIFSKITSYEKDFGANIRFANEEFALAGFSETAKYLDQLFLPISDYLYNRYGLQDIKELVTMPDINGRVALDFTARIEGNEAIQSSKIGDQKYDKNDLLINTTSTGKSILGGLGDDILIGGEGRDTLKGGVGNDVLQGRGGDDELQGGDGSDILVGGDGRDAYKFFTGDGSDIVIDSDGQGDIYINNVKYSSALQINIESEGWSASDGKGGKVKFLRSGEDLIVLYGSGDTVVIKNYVSGSLGLDLKDYAPPVLSMQGDTINGTADSDSLSGNSKNNIIRGLDGEDTVQGYSLDMSLYLGNDTIIGGAGSDRLFGGTGNDYIYAFSPESMGPVNSPVSGFGITGDWLDGRGGNDYIVGSAGQDGIFGGAGSDTITAGDGNDVIFADGITSDLLPDLVLDVKDVLIGQHLQKMVVVGATTSLATVKDSGDDVVIAGAGDDFVDGYSGNDYIEGNTGDDYLLGGQGDDTILGGDDNDILVGDGIDGESPEAPTAVMPGELHGNDYLLGGRGNDTVLGNGGSDKIFGGSGTDILYGDDRSTPAKYHGDDYIDGGEDDDVIVGGGGADTIYGGSGNDTIFGDALDEEEDIMEGAFQKGDYIDGGGGVDLIIGGGGNDTLLGGQGDDYLYGDTPNLPVDQHGHDLLKGGEGNDYIWGNGGDDTLEGGAGEDGLFGGEGNDTYVLEGVDYIYDTAGSNKIVVPYPSENITVNQTAYDFAVLIVDGVAIASIQGALNGFSFEFTNGQTRSWRELIGTQSAFALDTAANYGHADGSQFNDVLRGSSDSDTIIGGRGDDQIDGHGGADTILYRRGDGADVVIQQEGSLSIAFDESLNRNDVVLSRTPNGDLKLSMVDGGSLLIKDAFNASEAPINVKFADGSAMSDAQIKSIVHSELHGTSGADTLAGGTGSDKVFGLSGDDYLIGGGGADSLYGGAGQDTYRFYKGSGSVTAFDDPGEVSTLHLYALDPAGLVGQRSGNDLVLSLLRGEDTFTISDYFTSNSQWLLQDDKGSVTSLTSILQANDLARASRGDLANFAAAFNVEASNEFRSKIYGNGLNEADGSVGVVDYIIHTNEYFYKANPGNTVAVPENSKIVSDDTGKAFLTINSQNFISVAGEWVADEGLFTNDHEVGDSYYTVNVQRGSTQLVSKESEEFRSVEYKYIRVPINFELESPEYNLGQSSGITYIQYKHKEVESFTRNTYKYETTLSFSDFELANDLNNESKNPTLLDSGKYGIKVDLKQIGSSQLNINGSSQDDTIVLPAESLLFGRETQGWYSEDQVSDVISIWGSAGNDVLRTSSNSEDYYFNADTPSDRLGVGLLLAGEEGDDSIWGSSHNDYVSGGAGADYLNALGGADIYLFSLDDIGSTDIVEDTGQTLYESDGPSGLIDEIRFGKGIQKTDLHYSKSWYYNDSGVFLTLDISWAKDSVIRTVFDSITDYSYTAWDKAGLGIEIIGFNDGSQIQFSDALADATIAEDGLFLNNQDGVAVHAGSGNDLLIGAAANNIFYGDGGDDLLIGGEGYNELYGGEGADTLEGGKGQNHLYGENGDDTIRMKTEGDLFADGGSGDDYIEGGYGINELFGGAGTDTLIGHGSENYLSGGEGDDYLSASGAHNELYGGAGNDALSARGSYSELYGGSGDDTLSDSGDFQVLTGGEGSDIYDISFKGTETIIDNLDSSVGRVDVVQFSSEVSSTQIWFKQVGSDLELTFTNSSYRLSIRDWYAGDQYHIDKFLTADGRLLLGSQVQVLVDAMAALTLPAGEENDLTAEQREQLDRVIVSSWLDAESPGAQPIDGPVQREGSEGDDYLGGTAYGDTLIGADGNDILDGGAGDDRLFGDGGDDSLIGGAGNDYLDGGAGVDTLIGGAGDDNYVVDAPGDVVSEQTNEGIDTVESSISYTLGDNVENLTLVGSRAINASGNSLNNVLLGNASHNTLSGGEGDDTLFGGAGYDRLDGGAGADLLYGGVGNDIYIVDSAQDVVVEYAGEGTDRVEASITYTLTDNVENLTLTGEQNIDGIGNALNNVITGNEAANSLAGGEGNDSLIGGAGDDRLDGGAGRDTLIGGSGNDTYVVDRNSDVIIEDDGAGIDTVETSISYTLSANLENLLLTGTAALKGAGNNLNNLIMGNSANNVLNGVEGSDTMIGGAGNDTYVVDTASDVVIENANEGIDTVQSSVTYALSDNVENLTLIGTDTINATGNSLNNRLAGNDADNVLNGGAGNDRLDGQGGTDLLIGGTGNDTYLLGRGYGTDRVVENDITANNRDLALFAADISTDQLWFRHISDTNDLEISVIGTSDALVVENWYTGNASHIEQFKTADGKTLVDSKVQNLVDAMASFAPPAPGETILSDGYQAQLATVIAANWQ